MSSLPSSPRPVPTTPIPNLHSTSHSSECDATSVRADCDATVRRCARDATALQGARDATASLDAHDESPWDSRLPGVEASLRTQLPQIMPAGRVLIRPADVSALSQSAYQQTHRRMPSVHLSMAGSVSGKDQSSTTTPSFNTSVFVSDMDDPTSVRSLHHINMPEPLVSEPVARTRGMNPLLEQDAWLTKIREITVDIHSHKSKDNDVSDSHL
jgi:hypothetical protein